ncbi:NAD(P)-dependent alcohol dehydrogenase [Zobellia alginiliquefaciens]|uniref:NAD(P)-dependent alcohol dehydrogenase n=1 Tax=Zobellia alginiliquefaciens TaxID=3032586 RepID=UPI0023E38632|nr:NAD(P)-dependent alcohol dehydrogenase [Zobellia alginiliquefaciens]
MKAITFKKYGAPEKVLKITEVPKPTPKPNQVLVKVHATAINDYDWSMVRGKPYLYRLMFGLFKPKHPIMGMELAGRIESVGAEVTRFNVGDAVFGDVSESGFGTFAEYVCIEEKSLVNKPDELSYEEATSAPHAFGLAYQGLEDVGKIKKGDKILINGGGGGVGTLALQLAKNYDCEVTGVDSKAKLDMMKSIGFDHVIDYKKENFTQNGKTYDLILDCKTNKSAFSYPNLLTPNGAYVTIGGKLTSLLSIFFFGRLATAFSSKKLQILSLKTNKNLDDFIKLYTQNKINVRIDGPYPFEDIPRLVQYFGEGKHEGKVVVQMGKA